MTDERILELLKIERECVWRNHIGECTRDCLHCSLVQEDKDLLGMYDAVIAEYSRRKHV